MEKQSKNTNNAPEKDGVPVGSKAELLAFDDIYSSKIKYSPIIFDVGANQGQSILRFKKLFPDSVIHAFEPIKFEFEKLVELFGNDESIFLNNFAIGDKVEEKEFYITAKTGNSSFNRVTPNTEWLKVRSEQHNTSLEGYTKEVLKVSVMPLDDYCEQRNVSSIDILKIDTQGYEDKVLCGGQKILANNVVKFVETEIMFDDIYERYLTFSDIERFLLPNDFRFCAIHNSNNSLFEGLLFFADLLYYNTRLVDKG